MLWISQKNNLKGLPSPKYHPYIFEKKVSGFTTTKHTDNEVIFFTPPPKVIGEVTNAYSNFSNDVTFLSPAKRKTIFFSVLLAALLLGYGISTLLPVQLTGTIIITALSTLIIGLTGSNLILKRNTFNCVYLGKKGVVNFTMYDDINNITQDILIFDEQIVSQANVMTETNLLVIETTDYDFLWYANKFSIGFDKAIFNITGSSKDLGYFIGLETERQWIDYLYFEHVLNEIKNNGLYLYHSGITLFEQSFTFFHDGEKITVGKSDFNNLVYEIISTKSSSAEIRTPYICLQQNGGTIPISPLLTLPFNNNYYNLGILPKHIEHVKKLST